MLEPLAMPSASRPWPQASWNRVPPKPLPMTTDMGPVGAGRASSMVTALWAATRAMSCGDLLVYDLEAQALAEALVAGLDDAVAARHGAHREAHARAVVGHEGAQGVGHEQTLAAFEVAGADLGDGRVGGARRFVGGPQQRRLDVGGHGVGPHGDGGRDPRRAQRSEIGRRPRVPASPRSAAETASAASCRSASERSSE